MALTHLVDTSALKRLANSEVRAAIEQLAVAGALARPTICDLEIGYSARNEAAWDRLIGALDAFEPIQTTSTHIRRALQVQRLLATRASADEKFQTCLSRRPPKNMT
jgi:predicted nucleic acid-binding protein